MGRTVSLLCYWTCTFFSNSPLLCRFRNYLRAYKQLSLNCSTTVLHGQHSLMAKVVGESSSNIVVDRITGVANLLNNTWEFHFSFRLSPVSLEEVHSPSGFNSGCCCIDLISFEEMNGYPVPTPVAVLPAVFHLRRYKGCKILTKAAAARAVFQKKKETDYPISTKTEVVRAVFHHCLLLCPWS